MTISTGLPLVTINAPEFFRDAAFLGWLNAPSTATWHAKGEEPSEMSDVFFAFDDGDGSDAPVLPEDKRPTIPPHIWSEICRVVRPLHDECMVRITNLAE